MVFHYKYAMVVIELIQHVSIYAGREGVWRLGRGLLASRSAGGLAAALPASGVLKLLNLIEVEQM